MNPSKPRTVELVRSSYQPTKAEMEEEWDAPEGLTLEQITKAVLQPVRIRWVGQPRSRRRRGRSTGTEKSGYRHSSI